MLRAAAVIFSMLILAYYSEAYQNVMLQQSEHSASKFDEWGDITYEDTIARLDGFAIELMNSPGSQAYIIAYGGRNSLSGVGSRYALRAKNYLVKNRGIDPRRIVALNGGRREEIKVEIWFVPRGAVPPSPTPSVSLEQISLNVPYKYDESYYYDSVSESDDIDYTWSGDDEDRQARLAGFAEMLRSNSTARGYIIAYPIYYVSDTPFYDPVRGHFRTLRDSPSKIRRMLLSDRNYLIREHGISPSRIVTINGGYREGRMVELWIVSQGTPAPRPTPTRFPRTRTRRC